MRIKGPILVFLYSAHPQEQVVMGKGGDTAKSMATLETKWAISLVLKTWNLRGWVTP